VKFGGEGLDDFCFVLLQHCWAMRDWLVVSRTFPQADVERLFASDELKVCRDVANGMKHLRITRPSVDANFLVVREYVPAFLSEDGKEGSRPVVLAGGDKRDLIELCSSCFEQVRAFLLARAAAIPDADHLA